MSELSDFSAALGVSVNVPVVALGPAESKRVLDHCTSVLVGVAEYQQGKVLDSSGGNMSIVFPSAGQALQAARTMCRRISEMPPVADKKISVGIGAAVTLGKAMALMLSAEAGKIKADDEFDAALQPATIAPQGMMAAVEAELEAKSEAAAEISGESIPPGDAGTSTIRTRLTLTHQNITVIVDDQNREAKIGRGPECSVQINDPWASRIHATILKQGNRFVLLDSSTNGTFVVQGETPETKLHKRPLTLDGSGNFALGRTAKEAVGGPIFYVLL